MSRKQRTTVERIISGGQTGADRAALDVALAQGLEVGGFCPRGRRAEDGPIPARYPLRETASTAYAERTRRNVAAADATLILSLGRSLAGGTALTVRTAEEAGRPWHRVRLPATEEAAEATRQWLAGEAVRTLNVAGPRASEEPGVYDAVRNFMERLLPA